MDSLKIANNQEMSFPDVGIDNVNNKLDINSSSYEYHVNDDTTPIIINDDNGVTTTAIPMNLSSSGSDVESVEEVATKSCFAATFTEGYSFRNLIEYLKTNNSEGIFKFGPEYITYTQSNTVQTILNDVVIKAYELIEYEYIGDPNNHVFINVNITQLRDITKSIGKKDSMKIYTSPDIDDNYLYIQKTAPQSTDDRANLNFVRPLAIDNIVKYTLPEFTRSEKKPTCAIRGVEFTKMCKAMTSIKCENVTVSGYKKGVIFKSNMAGGQIGSIDKFGKCEADGVIDSISAMGLLPNYKSMASGNVIIKSNKACKINLVFSDPGEVCRINIDSSAIKQLSKLNNLSTNGNIKFYMEDNKPLKIMTNIGDYGVIRIYIRDS